jgi:hypothetical protein
MLFRVDVNGEQGYSVLLREVIDHFQTKHTPSQRDGHEPEGTIIIHQYDARLETASSMFEWGQILMAGDRAGDEEHQISVQLCWQ